MRHFIQLLMADAEGLSMEASGALFGVLIPALISAALLLAAWSPWKRRSPSEDRSEAPRVPWWSLALGCLAIGIGPIAADLLIRGRHGLWPVATTYYVPHATVVAIACGIALASDRSRLTGRGGGRALITVVASFAITYLLTQHRVKSQWTGLERIGWLVGLSLVPATLALSMDSLARNASDNGGVKPRPPGARLAILSWLAFSAAAVVLLFSGAAALGQVTGAFAAATGPFVLLGWWRRDLPTMRGAGVVAGLMLPSMLTVQFYNEVPLSAAALLVAIPMVAWIGRLGPMRRSPAWLATLISAILGAALAGTAIAISAPPAEENPLSYDQYTGE